MFESQAVRCGGRSAVAEPASLPVRGAAAPGGAQLPEPGPELAGLLAGISPADLPADELISGLAGWDQVISWATASQLRWMAEFARRRPVGDDSPAALPGGVSEYAEDEIAVALHIGRGAAGNRLGLALELERLPGTATALARGVIDPVKARAICDATGVLPQETASAVEARVLPVAQASTPAQLRRAVARAILLADPAAAEDEHRRARAERRVVLTPVGNGMAEIWALLPAADALTVYTALTTLARQARQAEVSGDGSDPTLPGDDNSAPPVSSHPAPPDSGHPATLGATDPAALGRTDRGPVGTDRRPVRRTLDQLRVDALVSLTSAALASPDLPRAGRTRPAVHVTVPACVLRGCSDHLAHLGGYGPIGGGAARGLAEQGVWHRLLTDPAAGTLLDLGRTTYVPTTALADHVRMRDGTCRFPGCTVPASRCDLDHTQPYSDEGITAATNLGALCRHHHRLKTHANWTLTQDSAATFTWTTPTSTTHITGPPDLTGGG